ncbi:hypothetical protein [Desertivirga xinjiangensis]|uniref:hypothetical protein n=1 Tax=Desertivirga xinjiangensis TaxID=539206 RepID=UPI00210C6397|nr:hypothetical protein [Pedobacter xinjiangensis]
MLKLTLPYLIILAAFSAVMAIGGVLYLDQDEPESFSQGVELLKRNKHVLAKIGTYRSHTWKATELPNEADNPANFRVSILGSTAKIYLHCKVRKDERGNWRLLRIMQDSIKFQE